MSYHNYPFHMTRYPSTIGNIKQAKHLQDEVIMYDIISENHCKSACYADEDCKIAVWKNDPDGGICTHKRKDPMYDIQSVDVIHTLDKPDYVSFVKPECHERCRVSSNPSESPFILQGICTRWLCDHGSCGERKQKQYLDCRPCVKLAEKMNPPSKDVQPSDSFVMQQRISDDDVILDFENDETLMVQSSNVDDCEQICLQDPRCKVAMFDTSDSSCLLKMITLDEWQKNVDIDKIEVTETRV